MNISQVTVLFGGRILVITLDLESFSRKSKRAKGRDLAVNNKPQRTESSEKYLLEVNIYLLTRLHVPSKSPMFFMS